MNRRGVSFVDRNMPSQIPPRRSGTGDEMRDRTRRLHWFGQSLVAEEPVKEPGWANGLWRRTTHHLYTVSDPYSKKPRVYQDVEL
jgi:hypothetical protein